MELNKKNCHGFKKRFVPCRCSFSWGMYGEKVWSIFFEPLSLSNLCSNSSDLTRVFTPNGGLYGKWDPLFHLISGKPRLVKHYNLARNLIKW